MIYPCGCSIHKVKAGLCSCYPEARSTPLGVAVFDLGLPHDVLCRCPPLRPYRRHRLDTRFGNRQYYDRRDLTKALGLSTDQALSETLAESSAYTIVRRYCAEISNGVFVRDEPWPGGEEPWDFSIAMDTLFVNYDCVYYHGATC